MKYVQVIVHVDYHDAKKFHDIHYSGGALYDELYYIGDNQWASNEAFDIDTKEGDTQCTNLQKCIYEDAKGIKFYIECKECLLNVIKQ